MFDTYPTDMVLADEEKTVSKKVENFSYPQKTLLEIWKCILLFLKVVKVNIWDTAGQEEFENLRT